MSRPDLVAAAREAGDADFDVLIACAFNYDARSTDFDKLGRIPVLKARMNADLHMADDLKNTSKGNLFVIFGEPDIDILPADGGTVGQIQVQINGVDVFHPQTGEVRSDGPEGIACWFIDTDDNEESFFVRHAYFLCANDPYKSLKTTLPGGSEWRTAQRAFLRRRSRSTDLSTAVLLEGARRGGSGTVHDAPHQLQDLSPDSLAGRPVARSGAARRGRHRRIPPWNDFRVHGPAPTIAVSATPEEEIRKFGRWLTDRLGEGLQPHEIALFVRSSDELPRALAAAEQAGVPAVVLDQRMSTTRGSVSVATMHLAKGLEFRAVGVIACDDEIVPLQSRIETVADDADLEDVYQTELRLDSE